MDFFHNYQIFNEGLDQKSSIEEIQKGILLIKDKETASNEKNLKRSLKYVSKVLNKSDVLKTDTLVQKHLINYDGVLKINAGDKYETVVKEDENYKKLSNYLTELEKSDNEFLKNYLKENPDVKKSIDDAVANKELEEKMKKESETTEKKEEKPVADSKMSDEDMKALVAKFKAANVTNVSAPLLSITNNKAKEANKALQLFLLKNGYFQTSEALDESSPIADGALGEKTANAIKAYQADKGLKADGIVGTQTWKAILNDIKFGIDNEKFKAIKPVSADKTEKADKKEEKETSASSKIEIIYDDALPQVTPVDKIVEVLTSQQLSSATFDTDELKVAKLLIGQCLVKGITETNGKDLLAKYKEKNNNGDLVKDLLYAFDSENVTSVNSRYKSIVQSKDNFEYITKQNWLKISNGNSLADQTKNLSLVFIAFAQTKSKELIDSMTANKIDINLINQINAIVPKTAEKTEKPAEETTKTEAPKVEI